jgi:8-oxo-dGTP pyrophosphatase MutT (NUDIX family)
MSAAVGANNPYSEEQPMTYDLEQGAEPVIRPAARVLLLDEADRILLFASISEQDGHTFWYPAGGGCADGETFERTAIREVREETGLTEIQLGPEVWRRRKILAWGGQTYDCRERYYTARVRGFEVDTSGFTEDERRSIVSHRWWTLAELAVTPDRLVPDDLHPRLADLLTDGPPERPIELS